MSFTTLTNWTIRLLYLQIAISVIGLITGSMEHSFLRDAQDGNFASEAEMMLAANASDSRQMIVGICQVLIYLISGIWILRWIYVACSNARELTTRPMTFTPGWSVGWYFIPVANLWKPYQAMKEIWRVSANPSHPDSETDPGLLVAWWAFYIAASMTGNAAFRVSLRADEIDELLVANVITRVSDVVGIPLAVILMFVVRRVRDNQMRARELVSDTEPENTVGAVA
jgi:hypothetical protein